MKYLQLSLFISFVFSGSLLFGQQNHFIYIQTENKQPFYVKLDKKILSSSSSGYLIIPQLNDGTYNLVIGFPKNEWAEANFTCLVDKRDLGYLLKNFGEKGWGLFNLQTLDVSMGGNSADKAVVNKTKTDEFSTMLSNVVHDPSILKAEPVKTEAERPVEKQVEKSIAEPDKKNDIKEINSGHDSLRESMNYGPSITKSQDYKNEEGEEIVYIEDYEGKKDTITVFIQFDNPDSSTNKAGNVKSDNIESEKINEENEQGSANQEKIIKESLGTTKEDTMAKDQNTKFLDIDLTVKDSVESKKNPDTATVVKPAVSDNHAVMIINSDCRNFATEDDFLKLRKKMASSEKDEEMLGIAKKSFKSRCFTTEQVKNLGVLFLTDAGKYSFYDLAYPFVSDSGNYSMLESQLTDTYYINRFKVMLRH